MLKTLEDEVKCPLCLDVFANPKMLPCQHVFCGRCLQALVTRGSKTVFKCPVCQKDIPIDGFDAGQFPQAIHTNRFIDMYQRALEGASSLPVVVPVSCETKAQVCSTHASQSLALYCETCDKLVCRDCVITICSKKDHSYDFLEAVEKKIKDNIQENMAPMKDLHRKVVSALETMKMDNREKRVQKEMDIQKVNGAFNALRKLLENEEHYFLSVIERQFEEQMAKEQDLAKADEELASIVSSIENKLKRDEGITLELSKGRKLITSLERYVDLKSEELPELSMNIISGEQFEAMLQERNYFMLEHSDLSTSVSLDSLEIGKTFTATFTIPESREAFQVNSRMVVWRDGSSSLVAVTRHSDRFTLSFVPARIGRHTLHITHNGKHLCGSPLPAFVSIDPKALDFAEPLKVHYMDCVAVKSTTCDIYITRAKKAIDMIDLSPEAKVKPMVLRTIPAEGIVEFTVHNNFIFMTTSKEYIVKMDMNTNVVATAGGKGFLLGLFHAINSIKVNKADEVFVCDTKNHRIQVFDINLNFLRSFGRKGSGPGEFNTPDDLEFDEEGSVYVTEEMNHRIQVLSPKGTHIRFIGHQGSGPGELARPVSLVQHRGCLYVTDAGNHRVSVFTMSGSFVTSFGENILSYPESIAIDQDGFIYITDNRKTLIRY